MRGEVAGGLTSTLFENPSKMPAVTTTCTTTSTAGGVTTTTTTTTTTTATQEGPPPIVPDDGAAAEDGPTDWTTKEWYVDRPLSPDTHVSVHPFFKVKAGKDVEFATVANQIVELVELNEPGNLYFGWSYLESDEQKSDMKVRTFTSSATGASTFAFTEGCELCHVCMS